MQQHDGQVRTGGWAAQRAAALADPGGFHGAIAARNLHWHVDGAWLSDTGTGAWQGWADDGRPVTRNPGSGFTPWAMALDTSNPPHWRWFSGGRTNACFNQVDRHVLAGHGDEAAFIFEGDRWDMAHDGGKGRPVDCETVSRKRLLLEVARAAVALQHLGLKAGDRIALNMPNVPGQMYWTLAAQRLGIVYTPVFGGFSDKTLSDRIHDAGAKVIVTADGGYRNAQIVPFKTAYTDPALDNFVAVPVAVGLLRTRLAGSDLDLPQDTAATIIATVEATLKGEVTVERGDVMRGVGRALAGLGQAIDAGQAARIRIAVAEALVATPPRVEAVVVVRHAGVADIVWRDRDVWAHDLTAKASAEILTNARAAGFDVADEAALLALPDADFVRAIWATSRPLPVDAEYPLFFIYTSGSTGKPKGVVHVHGGWLSGVVETMTAAFGATPGDVLYVVADPGWITGQAYMYAAALGSRVTTVLTEGAPVFPHAGRFASIIERHGVTIFKAGVTFLKAVMQDPDNVRDIGRYDLAGLKTATFCAEPVSPPVHEFGMKVVTPRYINSYWATEHGGIAWTLPIDSEFTLAPDARTFPLPWIIGDVWVEEESGEGATTTYNRDEATGVRWRRADDGEKGEIVIAAPYPYLARTVWGDPEHFTVSDGTVNPAWRGDAARWEDGYWRRWRGSWAYTQGDFAVRYADGGFSLHGRSDDVINVSGHRMGTEEIEGAILRDKALHPDSPVGNVLVVGAPHREKGLTPVAFVQPAPGRVLTRDDQRRLADLVRTEKGAVAVPSDFLIVSAFPETRSGKYMRRMVRALVEGGETGDATTLRNPESLDELRRVIADWQRRQRLSEDQQVFDRYRYFRVQYTPVAPGKRVATVYVANPPVNALNERAIDELAVIVDGLARRDDVAAVVFTGDGTASFVAGADIRQFLDEIHDIDEALVLPNNAQLAFARIEAMGKPCVAAINGVALGGGMEFALACHYRVADAGARFGQPEIRLRLIPGYGGTQRLPRLLADKRGADGVRDALDLILGGRSIDAGQAEAIGLVETVADASADALTLAHAAVRDWLRHGDASPLGAAFADRQAALTGWDKASAIDLDAVLADDFIGRICRQLAWAGRGGAGDRAVEAVRIGLAQGYRAGLAREAQLFAEAVVDPQGGKTGIRQFLDKMSPPLPIRRDALDQCVNAADRGTRLERNGELLPLGAAFHPGVTPIPGWQYAFGVPRDPDTGAPRFGPPATSEVQLIVPVPEPEPNEALVYLVTSEVNFNDIWALTGIPVSPFDGHEEDVQITGSGGLALVAALGSEARGEGRLKVGDLVAVYSGTSDLLSPLAGRDPMYADFAIQGYETKSGSHAQFLTVQAPQLHPLAGDLTLEQAGSYILNLGTIVRALFTTLEIEAGKTIFVEGSATGTGLDALKTAKASGLKVTGLVSSPERAAFVEAKGAVGAIDRTDARFRDLYTEVPDGGREAWAKWEAAGEPLRAEFARLNGGALADYAVSHAGETAFPRSFQLLGDGGVLAFYGASSGYHLSFMGKAGAATPEAMLRKARARGGEAALIFYGAGEGLADQPGLEMIEAVRAIGCRIVVVTRTDGQRELLLSLGFEDAVAGVVSLEELKRRHGAEFDWPETMPRLPVARHDIEAFRAAVRDFQDRTLKPFGNAVGRLLRSPDNPRGAPDIVLERAGKDTLGVTTALVKPFTGRVVYWEDMAGQRYNFYAPQVWTRQRRIVMPTAEIRGTHLCNAYEVTRMNDMVAAGALDVTEPTVVPWDGLPEAHQAMWENRHTGATYIVNHALPAMGLRSKDELFEAWAARDAGEMGA